MADLDLLIAGAMITFIAVSGAYVAIRHRANESPVESYNAPEANRHGYDPVAAHQLDGSTRHERLPQPQN